MVYVVIVSWNGRRLLAACLDSLRRQTVRPAAIVVVDNGSTDGTPDIVRHQYPEVQLIENGHNLGFAAGSNVGLRHALAAGAEFVVLLNQDTEVEPRWLEELLKAAAMDARIAAVSSRILFWHIEHSLTAQVLS